ncbi:hypothetical protein PCE1_004786 [Barthelona sp. PCE]
MRFFLKTNQGTTVCTTAMLKQKLAEDIHCSAINQIEEGCTVFAHEDVLGAGKKKHKRKVYKTPKKDKHKHKNEKMGILRLFKVNEDGSVERLTYECEMCGAGVYMANHKKKTPVRYACGKCGARSD